MRADGQQGVERMDGSSPFLHAAVRLLAPDWNPGVRNACAVLREIETAEAFRLRSSGTASAACLARPSRVQATERNA